MAATLSLPSLLHPLPLLSPYRCSAPQRPPFTARRTPKSLVQAFPNARPSPIVRARATASSILSSRLLEEEDDELDDEEEEYENQEAVNIAEDVSQVLLSSLLPRLGIG